MGASNKTVTAYTSPTQCSRILLRCNHCRTTVDLISHIAIGHNGQNWVAASPTKYHVRSEVIDDLAKLASFPNDKQSISKFMKDTVFRKELTHIQYSTFTIHARTRSQWYIFTNVHIGISDNIGYAFGRKRHILQMVIYMVWLVWTCATLNDLHLDPTLIMWLDWPQYPSLSLTYEFRSSSIWILYFLWLIVRAVYSYCIVPMRK